MERWRGNPILGISSGLNYCMIFSWSPPFWKCFFICNMRESRLLLL